MASGTVVSRVVEGLRRDISIGALKPGCKLRIEHVRNQYKVSHPSVREALSILVGEGYVTSTEQRGFRVSESSVDELLDIVRVRSEFECIAFEWSLSKADTDWRAKVVSAHHALQEVEQELEVNHNEFLIEWDERNRDFHLAVASNCGSPALIDSIAAQYDKSRRYRFSAYSVELVDKSRTTWLQSSSREHSDLKDAVLTGDLKAGTAVLRKHIKKSIVGLDDTIVPLSLHRGKG